VRLSGEASIRIDRLSPPVRIKLGNSAPLCGYILPSSSATAISEALPLIIRMRSYTREMWWVPLSQGIIAIQQVLQLCFETGVDWLNREFTLQAF